MIPFCRFLLASYVICTCSPFTCQFWILYLIHMNNGKAIIVTGSIIAVDCTRFPLCPCMVTECFAFIFMSLGLYIMYWRNKEFKNFVIVILILKKYDFWKCFLGVGRRFIWEIVNKNVDGVTRWWCHTKYVFI